MALGEYLGAGSSVTKGLYRLNGNANDASGNGNNGTVTSVTWVGGVLGSGAASFNGATPDGISIPAGARTTGNFTLSVWLLTTTLTPSNSQNVIFSDWRSTQRNFFVEQTGSTLRFRHGNGGGSGGVNFSGGTLTINTRYNAVFTRNGTVKKIYLNGVEVATNTTADTGGGTTGVLYIGCDTGLSPGYGREGFLDEVIIENRVRTPIEIKKYYTFAKGRFGI